MPLSWRDDVVVVVVVVVAQLRIKAARVNWKLGKRPLPRLGVGTCTYSWAIFTLGVLSAIFHPDAHATLQLPL